jgi:sugar O-acyltransferase (sialic acid O-acetyltransferase NeuD family)
MTERIFIFGASGHGKVVADAAQRQGYRVVGFFDDAPARWGDSLLGIPVEGGRASLPDWCRKQGIGAGIVAIGDNVTRLAMAGFLQAQGLRMVTVVHPGAIVAASARIGQGSVVMAGAVVNPDCVIGEHCIINTGACVDHDCHLGDAVHIAPGCRLCGGVSVGAGTLVGAGATVIPGIGIGAHAIVGAGATVIREVPDRVKVVGCPARVLP